VVVVGGEGGQNRSIQLNAHSSNVVQSTSYTLSIKRRAPCTVWPLSNQTDIFLGSEPSCLWSRRRFYLVSLSVCSQKLGAACRFFADGRLSTVGCSRQTVAGLC